MKIRSVFSGDMSHIVEKYRILQCWRIHEKFLDPYLLTVTECRSNKYWKYLLILAVIAAVK